TRIDTAGNLLWHYDYDANQERWPDLLLAVPDGYIVASHFVGYGPADSAFLYKTDLNGNLLWERSFVDSTWTTQLPAQLYVDSTSGALIFTTRGRAYQTASGT